MRCALRLVSTLCVCALSVSAQGLSNLDLQENDVCRSEGELEWICRKAVECPEVGDFRYTRPGICSFQGKMPVICCPPPLFNRFSAFRHSHARVYCENMMNSCRKPHGPMRFFPGFSGGGGRFGGGRFGGGFVENRNKFYPLDKRPSIIVGGQMTLPRTRSYSVLVGFGEFESPQWNCGGSIISERFILSAAHCSQTRSMGPAKWVLVGDLDLTRSDDDAKPQQLMIVKRLVHPEYKEPGVDNDIALFMLDEEIAFSEWVRPVCLHSTLEIPTKFATATGWGRTEITSDTSPQLREVDLTIYSEEDCGKILNASRARLPHVLNMGRLLCAGEPEGGKDTCSGDSGGPLVIEEPDKCLYTQVGITSFGKQCALPNSPGIYTRVSHFVPWIESIVWPHSQF